IVFGDDFESGTLANWTVTSSSPAPSTVGSPVHGGSFAADLGSLPGGETPGDAAMFHLFTALPANATLDFWTFFRTVDSISFDWQDAYIQDSSGNILQTIYHLASNTQTWTHQTVDLSAYAGQNIRVAFLTHGDNAGDPTDQIIDDLTVTVPGVP